MCIIMQINSILSGSPLDTVSICLVFMLGTLYQGGFETLFS